MHNLLIMSWKKPFEHAVQLRAALTVVVVGVLVGAAAERHSNTRAGKRPVGAVMVTFFLEAVPCAKANTLFT